jgi:hypothetical protein
MPGYQCKECCTELPGLRELRKVTRVKSSM